VDLEPPVQEHREAPVVLALARPVEVTTTPAQRASNFTVKSGQKSHHDLTKVPEIDFRLKTTESELWKHDSLSLLMNFQQKKFNQAIA
jgi:hypothetical protein